MDAGEIRAALVEGIEGLDLARRRFTELLAEIDGLVGVQIPRQGRWTPSMLEELWATVEHLPGVRALFELTAEHPNGVVTFDQIRERSGLTSLAQRNEHAALGRMANRLFGEKRWPIENWQGAPPHGGRAVMQYRMTATISEWWTRIVEPAR
jgi:hypothetical protein